MSRVHEHTQNERECARRGIVQCGHDPNVSEAVSRIGKVLARAESSTIALTRASYIPPRTRLLTIVMVITPCGRSRQIVPGHITGIPQPAWASHS